jgi:Protein of unknown function (DUF2950)
MRSASDLSTLWMAGVVACTFLPGSVCLAQDASAKSAPAATVAHTKFDTAQQGADALVDAAGKFDVDALDKMFGPGAEGLVQSGDPAQDKERAKEFAAQAHEKMSVSVDRKGGDRAFVLVGQNEWPFPVPLVKHDGKWSFDGKAGRQEILYRRIGDNELDAINVCRGYVDAQKAFAFQKVEGYSVHQYAQKIIGTYNKRDGLAWQNPDGTWGGPVGEKVAKAIEQGFSAGQPYHGYYYKILKGQGPAAPFGAIDFVVKGVMIGGFALAAAPAEYRQTGVKTFIVSHHGVVYEKDLGPNTLEEFKKMELFNPDKSWKPVRDEDETQVKTASVKKTE